jgi:phage-related protein
VTVLRELITRLTLQTDPAKIAQFQTQLGQARAETQKLSSALGGVAGQLAGIAAGMVGGLGFRSITTELAEETHILHNHSKAVGMTVEEYSRLQAASAQFVEETGKDMRDFLADLADYGRDALANPTGGYADDLKALGVELKDSEGKLKSQFDLLLAVSDAMTQVPLTAERMGIVSAVFSSGGLEMAEFLQLGREGIMAQMAAVDAAAITTERHVKVSKEFRGAMMGVANVVQQLRLEMGMRLMPTLTKNAREFVKWLKGTDNGARSVQVLIGALRMLGAVLLSVSAVKFGMFLKQLTIATIAWTKATMGAVRAFGLLKAGLLAIPAALILIALLIEDIVVWSEGGDSAIGSFIDRFYESEGILGDFARFLRDNTFEIIAFATAIWDAAKSIPLLAWNALQAVMPIFQAVVGAVSSTIGRIMGALSGAGGGLRAVAAAYWEALQANGKQVWSAIEAALDAIVELVVEVVNSGLIQSLLSLGRQIVTSAVTIVKALIPIVVTLAKTIIGIVQTLMPPIMRLISAIVGAVQRLIPTASNVVRIITGLVAKLMPYIMDIVSALVAGIEVALNDILPIIIWVIEQVLKYATILIEWLLMAINWVLEGVGWIIDKVSKLAGWVIDNLITPVVNFLGWAAEGVGQIFRGIFDGVVDAAQPVIDLINWAIGKVDWAADVLGLGGGGPEWTSDGIASLKDVTASIRSGELIEKLSASAGPAAVGMGAAPGAWAVTNTTSVGTLQVTVQGTTDMGPGELAKATQTGVQDGMTKAAGRDLGVGGG